MKKSEFEHAIRAAGAILGIDEVLIIGSQAIHGTVDTLFAEAERSIEVDVATLGNDAELQADLIDGSIGELSLFQSTFGYYAQGVTPDSAVLPSGWRKRLTPYRSAGTNGITALCLEPHDLWVSKAMANRQKDKDFCGAMIKHGIVDKDVLLARLKQVRGVDGVIKEIARSWISDFAQNASTE